MFKRWLNIITLMAMLLGTFAFAAPTPAAPFPGEIAAPPPPDEKSAPAVQIAEEEQERKPQEFQPPVIAPAVALSKLHPDLREMTQTASPMLPEEVGPLAMGEPGTIFVQVFAKAGTDLSAYLTDVKARPVIDKSANPTQAFIGSIQPTALLKLASLPEVGAIIPMVIEKDGEPMPYPPDDEVQVPEKGPDDWAALRANADQVRAGSLPWSQAKAFGDGRTTPIQPMDWFEQSPDGPHKAEVAWDRGYDGAGVTAAVNDDGIDFAHPDLMGTQKIYSSTVHSEYNGWPMAYSPFSMWLYALNPLYIAYGQPGVDYADTSETPDVTPCGSGISCLQYEPLIDWATWTGPHTYIISDTMSKSGVVHIGTHPDLSLRDYVWGEKVAVLVCDPNTAGVYDTVYVDLNDDYDFRDEKPLSRADTTDETTLAATYNDMIAYRDMNGDGMADISGGALYFIADGVSDIPVSDYMWGGLTPGNGDLVAFTGGSLSGGYSHGTQCASNVAGQGVVQGPMAPDNDMLPSFRDLPGDGKPAGAVFGGAPGAKLISVGNIYWDHFFSSLDAFTFGAIGYDGCDQTGWDVNTGGVCTDTDAIQMSSNSYGGSATDNDGWEFRGRFVSNLQRNYAPYMQLLFSTGNGAPAYGTTAPPSPDTAIAVGASTQFGSTGWDSITDTYQIMNNDVTPFSNRGPGARGSAGVDVVAGGAFAGGDEALNYYSISVWGELNGNLSWGAWGGTSRSAPAAMGILATIYHAYYDANGVWPTYDVAKALFMSTSSDLNYDVFSQGAGSVNADRGTAVAGGLYGLFVEDNAWQPGDYQGVDYPGFAHIVYPGDVFTKTFTINNTGVETITANIADTELRRIDSAEFTFTVTPDMVTAESVYGAENRDNFYKAFNYFIPLTATAGMDASWYNVDVPADADLMVVRQMFPYDEFDVDGDYGWDNRFYLAVYNWQDVNDDGDVWEDKDGNGVVNFINGPDIVADASPELLWDDARTELDRWEFGRFSYNRPGGNRNEMWVHDPLDRMIDGLFLGLRHHPGSTYTGTTTISYRIDFYEKEDVSWLATDVASLEVAPGTSEDFVATTTVPVDMEPGSYEAAIEVYDSGWLTYTEDTSVIPVVLSVAAKFSDGMTLGGYDAYDPDAPYPNAAVRGLFDWTWRAESGDWRFFYVDVENCVIETVYQEDFETDDGGYVISGTNPSWAWGAPTSGPSAAHSGVNVWATNLAGDYNSSEDSYIELEIDLSAYAGQDIILDWWEYADAESGWDSWYADVSNDGGGSWTRLQWWTGNTGAYWNPEFTLAPAYAVSNFRIRFGLISDGSTQESGLYVDDVTISTTTCAYPEGAKFLIKDEWDDVAPHTDIDTIVLGPTEDCASNGVGCGGLQTGSEPGYYGPYTLDTVGKSVNANAGGGTWRFNTSSGTNEDWVAASFPDWTADRGGLHEILQHNVLFEGDKFDVVFTKTLGTLQEDPHEYDIETHVDQGTVGVMNLQASLPLNGLVAEAYGLGGPEYFTNEPVGFVSSGSIEWTDIFAVEHAAKLTLDTSSPDISDIDLYLFYDTGTGWAQVGASTTSSSNEHVELVMPPDGTYLVGINNWSGPAGHFNLTRNVMQGYDLTVSGLPTGAIAANTPVSFTINFSSTMKPGETYEGLLLIGPPEAPALKEVSISITRLAESAMIEKSAEYETVFSGLEFDYTIDLYNLADPAADFEFTDPIPAGTEFVAVTGGCCTEVSLFEEDFEGAFPPAGWSVVVNGGAGGEWNTNTYWGRDNVTSGTGQSAAADSDDYGGGMDTELWSPPIDLTGMAAADQPMLSFMSNFQDYAGGGDGWLDISTDGGGSWTNLYYQTTDDPSMTAGVYREFDLSAYTGMTVTLRWHYDDNGVWAWWWQIDDVRVVVTSCDPPTYDAVNNRLIYTGTMPLGTALAPANVEGFEDADWPQGWVIDNVIPGGVGGWFHVDAATYPTFVHTGDYAAWANYSEIDIRMYSPWLDLTTPATTTLSFWGNTDTDNPNATMTVYAREEDGTTTAVWNMHDEAWGGSFEYRQAFVDLSAFAGKQIRLEWWYESTGGAGASSFGLDDIVLPGNMTPIYIPSCSVILTVRVTDTVAAGSYITNTATLVATHDMPQGLDVKTVMDDAVVHVGLEDFITSYKEATTEVATGDVIAYAVHVINTGDKVAYVTFTDPIPVSTTYVSHVYNGPYYDYNATLDQMEWAGNIAPGEWVFEFEVVVDDGSALWGTTIENIATIEWNGDTMPLSAETDIVPPYKIYLPLVLKQ